MKTTRSIWLLACLSATGTGCGLFSPATPDAGPGALPPTAYGLATDPLPDDAIEVDPSAFQAMEAVYVPFQWAKDHVYSMVVLLSVQ